jgi:hypothetical protein
VERIDLLMWFEDLPVWDERMAVFDFHECLTPAGRGWLSEKKGVQHGIRSFFTKPHATGS